MQALRFLSYPVKPRVFSRHEEGDVPPAASLENGSVPREYLRAGKERNCRHSDGLAVLCWDAFMEVCVFFWAEFWFCPLLVTQAWSKSPELGPATENRSQTGTILGLVPLRQRLDQAHGYPAVSPSQAPAIQCNNPFCTADGYFVPSSPHNSGRFFFLLLSPCFEG